MVLYFMEQFNEAATFAQSHEIPWARDPTTDTSIGASTTMTRRRSTACAARCIRAGRLGRHSCAR